MSEFDFNGATPEQILAQVQREEANREIPLLSSRQISKANKAKDAALAAALSNFTPARQLSDSGMYVAPHQPYQPVEPYAPRKIELKMAKDLDHIKKLLFAILAIMLGMSLHTLSVDPVSKSVVFGPNAPPSQVAGGSTVTINV